MKGSPVLCSLCFSLGNTKPALVLGVSEATNQRFDPPTLYQSLEVWTSLYEYELAASSIPPAPAFPRAAMQTGRYFKRNKKELTSGLRAAECYSKMSVPWPSPFLSRVISATFSTLLHCNLFAPFFSPCCCSWSPGSMPNILPTWGEHLHIATVLRYTALLCLWLHSEQRTFLDCEVGAVGCLRNSATAWWYGSLSGKKVGK